MVNNWDSLKFKPIYSKEFYDFQLDTMRSYMILLKHKAIKENIDLD